MRILIVEDERAIADVERAYMEAEGYLTDIAGDGTRALELFNSGNIYDLIVLDLMLPGIHGLDICRIIREKSSVPIIMLTARSGEDDIIMGLDAGADDYIIKPFSPRVLMARIRANIRNTPKTKSENSPDAQKYLIALGENIVIDTLSFTVKKDGTDIPFTRNEFLIFAQMAGKPDKVWTRDELITYALGDDYEGFERSIDSYIKNIRKKLMDSEHENGYIKTVHGFGYKISC